MEADRRDYVQQMGLNHDHTVDDADARPGVVRGSLSETAWRQSGVARGIGRIPRREAR